MVGNLGLLLPRFEEIRGLNTAVCSPCHKSQVTNPSLLLKVPQPTSVVSLSTRCTCRTCFLLRCFDAAKLGNSLAFFSISPGYLFRLGHQCVRWTLGTFSFAFAGTGEKCIATKCDAWLCKLTVLSRAFYELHVGSRW